MPQKTDLTSITPLDAAGIEAEARAWVERQITDCVFMESQLEKAAAIVNEYDQLETSFREERDRVALAIQHFYNVRRGASVHAAIGVNRTRWSAMRQEAGNRRHLRRYADPDRLVELAAATYQARMRAHYAREARDAAVRYLSETMTNVEIGALIGRNPSQVSHIKYPKAAEPVA